MKVYAYQEKIFDHHNFWDTKQIVFSTEKPGDKEYQEFDVENLNDLIFDGERTKVISKL